MLKTLHCKICECSFSEKIISKWEEKKKNGKGKGGKFSEKGNTYERKIFGEGKGKTYSKKGNIRTAGEMKKGGGGKKGKYLEK